MKNTPIGWTKMYLHNTPKIHITYPPPFSPSPPFFPSLSLRKTDRLAGWWGHNAETRFDMTKPYDPIPGPFGYRLSNPPVVCTASLLGSLRVVEEAGGIGEMRKKSLLLTQYLG